MNGIGTHHPIIVETNYRINEIQREAKLAHLRRQALQLDAQPTLFNSLTLSLAALLKTNHIEADVALTDENLGQPVLKRSTATFSRV